MGMEVRKENASYPGLVARYVAPAFFFLILLVVWQLITEFRFVEPYVLPSPTSIGRRLVADWHGLMHDLWLTMLEAVLGFLGANLAGIILAILMAAFPVIEKAVLPWLVGLKAVPIVALSPLLLLWFGPGLLGKSVMAGVIAFFPVTVNALTGFKAIDRDLEDLLRTLGASRVQKFTHLYLPSAMPAIFAGLKVSSTLATLGAVVAELAGAKEGIGATILIASYQMDVELMFAAIVLIAIGGNLFYFAVALWEKLVIKWHTSPMI